MVEPEDIRTEVVWINGPWRLDLYFKGELRESSDLSEPLTERKAREMAKRFGWDFRVDSVDGA